MKRSTSRPQDRKVDGTRKSAAVIAAEQERLREMVRYAYARTCRRALLLDYFGDEAHACSDDAGACDSCGIGAQRVLPDGTGADGCTTCGPC
jgi:superfamily II DNA helicase RecQ